MKSTKINLIKYVPNLEKIADTMHTELSEIRVTNSLTDDICNQIIDKIKEKYSFTIEQTFVVIAGVLQRGGTNKSARSNTKFIMNGISFSAQDLQNIINTISKNSTNRQFARAMANEIAEIALTLSIEGDLANQMRFEYPDLSSTEAVWCSNFQTTNPNCPDRVRKWLVNNYKNRFNK
jgi:hypothetical protein